MRARGEVYATCLFSKLFGIVCEFVASFLHKSANINIEQAFAAKQPTAITPTNISAPAPAPVTNAVTPMSTNGKVAPRAVTTSIALTSYPGLSAGYGRLLALLKYSLPRQRLLRCHCASLRMHFCSVSMRATLKSWRTDSSLLLCRH